MGFYELKFCSLYAWKPAASEFQDQLSSFVLNNFQKGQSDKQAMKILSMAEVCFVSHINTASECI